MPAMTNRTLFDPPPNPAPVGDPLPSAKQSPVEPPPSAPMRSNVPEMPAHGSAPLRHSNVPEMSVADLANALRRTLEESFGRVRVRGELSGLKLASSGHLYGTIKDADAVIDIVCWKGNLSKLSIRPEDGLDVVCVGKVSSYPKSSRYQIIVDSIELAGEGALLKMLEDRRKKLAAEGLFDAARKKPIPFLPTVIGVVTSPTGAVIRDIMHRLNDRFPRHVLLWPVAVQGDNAAAQIAAAIAGFDALPKDGSVPRPDVVIVARGGGSLEDLMAFNEEIVVRAAAACSIPLISAVGHETDTTLIDYAADMRAPTPTGAAEMAVPVRAELMAQIMDDARRLMGGMNRITDRHHERVVSLAARLGDPQKLLQIKTQAADHAIHRLDAAFDKTVQARIAKLDRLSAALRHPRQIVEDAGRRLSERAERLIRAAQTITPDKARTLTATVRVLDSLSFERVLDRGFVVVRDAAGTPVSNADALAKGSDITLEFRDKKHRTATVKD